ncbi:zinc finger MYND domain-containing protein 12 [Lycaon pictus]|uniref:Zinc finger MYND-type containing 12 n=2 Tax=Canis lupus familiaris TaxID=9615 RepID=A0A8C0PAP3_CANLF|nr:zinc finger MYND domain-containing protein 12 isoform X5 [Canis lupus dingo]XP_038413607.1 zinc finger MYND domain-containing protein 12 isoform X5 [Canis lupus familiaris]XP_038543268.1 zinc finger MYND domain-containing protein 12 isoform X5 [Canis lupus familiaris]XP_539561.2 zinc finger MYND domain-containing protein 12 isoform X5 [Canis lupus familiaris]|eukprot:XP_539561.2 zinc finger MYND domain-containing protein 12 isoform X1 [Canis lupus familiaris]
MDRIYPLAVPKGRRLCCEVCEAPAERVCTACTVTYYCGLVHQRADWSSIHEKICQLLIPLRTSMPFYNSEEERRHGLQQLQQRQKHLIEFCYTVAQKYLFEGKHEAAVPAALHSLRFRMSVHGLSSVELVPAYLLLAEASLGLGQIVQAEEYLSQAQWTVLKSTECCYATQSLLHRNLGLLSIAKENYEEARYHLANDIYFASCAFGTEDIRTSGGYFHLANIFYGLKKLDLADTLYTKIAEIWSKYLNNRYQVLSQNRIQQIDLLGKRFETDTGLDEAQEAEAIQILTSIWNIRESTSNTDPQKTIFVLKILVMLYYLMMNSSKAQEYAMRAFSLAKEQHLSVNEQSTIEDLLNMISAEEAHPIT